MTENDKLNLITQRWGKLSVKASKMSGFFFISFYRNYKFEIQALRKKIGGNKKHFKSVNHRWWCSWWIPKSEEKQKKKKQIAPFCWTNWSTDQLNRLSIIHASNEKTNLRFTQIIIEISLWARRSSMLRQKHITPTERSKKESSEILAPAHQITKWRFRFVFCFSRSTIFVMIASTKRSRSNRYMFKRFVIAMRLYFVVHVNKDLCETTPS